MGTVPAETLLNTFALLTHRMHATRQMPDPAEAEAKHLDLRHQRDAVQAEILRRMG